MRPVRTTLFRTTFVAVGAGAVLVAEEFLGFEEKVSQFRVGGELDLEGVGSEGFDLRTSSRGRCMARQS